MSVRSTTVADSWSRTEGCDAGYDYDLLVNVLSASLVAAIQYGERGWNVFPVRVTMLENGNKDVRPLVKWEGSRHY